MLELLSPAGSPEAVIAAVQSGADAVYMGFGAHNARQGAKNFTDEEFEDAVKYCRVRGCRVYLTLNTLVSDREMTEASKLAQKAAELGVSAIIVQDLGLVRVLKSLIPDMPIHASTQMSVHNLEGVLAAAELGISRVVLARELSFEQIEYIARRSPIELEVFVHGALCFGHSGQCYMSSLIGTHSGNRGKCSQTCRMDFSTGSRMDEKPMSLKDNCLIHYLEELERIGIVSAKIEGRGKRPEYTAVVTEIYSKLLKNRTPPTPSDMQRLELAFSRQGFTDGYMKGEIGAHMLGVRQDPDRSVERLYSETRKKYINAEARRVPVIMFAVIRAGARSLFAIEDENGLHATAEGPAPQRSVSREINEEYITRQLYKTGGTPYYCVNINCKVGEGLYLSASDLNEVRRELISKLTQMRREKLVRAEGSFPQSPLSAAQKGTPKIICQVTNAEQLSPELCETRPDYLYVPLEIIHTNYELVSNFVKNNIAVCAVLPRIITDSERSEVLDMLKHVSALGITEALVGNLGHIALCRQVGVAIRGDFGLNTFNTHSAEILRMAGLMSVTASFELRLSQIRDMIKPVNTEMIAYGRLPSMITDQCIIKNSAGRCNCENVTQLNDKRGAIFPVIREFGHRNVVLNAHKLYLADKRADYENIGLWGIRLLFTTESSRECVNVVKNYMGQSKIIMTNITRGLYYRGVV